MNSNLSIILSFLEKCEQKLDKPALGGRPLVYSRASMIVFLISMLLHRRFCFRTMATYAAVHYQAYGWQNPPTRRTLQRRFVGLSLLLPQVLTQVARQCEPLERTVFAFRWAFADKSVFRALGGLWHKAQIRLGIVPHPSIDTDASWGYSPYHRWRFGYGLHLLVNQHRFPLAAQVSTAKTKDYHLLESLLGGLADKIGVVVADAGYLAYRVFKRVAALGVFVYTHLLFKPSTDPFKTQYNQLAATAQARCLYARRKPSVEPVFALIKELFALKGDTPLPYRGLPKVSAFLLTTVVTVQLLMVLNHTLGLPLAKTDSITNHL